MSVREYIGARYVPLFADPIEWDNTKTYEPLTIVYYQGNSYTSRQAVPTGIAITNETYWALTGNYNAQIEAYREEVQEYSDRIADVEDKFPVATSDITDEAVTTAKLDDEAVTEDKLDDEAVTTAKLDDGAVTTAKLADSNVTTPKIANHAVTLDKIEEGLITRLFNGCNILGVTDSWGVEGSHSVSTNWMHLVANALNANFTNLAIGSRGYVAGTTTFKQSLQTYAANHDPSAVDMIILCGSPNDAANSDTDIINAIVDTLNYATATFTNAIINFVVQPVNFDMNLAGASYSAYNIWAKTVKNNYNAVLTYPKSNVVLNDSLVYALLGKDSAFDDNVHPNQTGQNILAQAFMTSLLGSGFRYRQAAFGGATIGTAQYQPDTTGASLISSESVAANNSYVQYGDTFDIRRLDKIGAVSGNTNTILYFAIPNLVVADTQNISGWGTGYNSQAKFTPIEVSIVNQQQTFASGTHRQTLVKLDFGRYLGGNLADGTHIFNWEVNIPLRYGI